MNINIELSKDDKVELISEMIRNGELMIFDWKNKRAVECTDDESNKDYTYVKLNGDAIQITFNYPEDMLND